jgi:DNA-binding transcriptional regulator YiaG
MRGMKDLDRLLSYTAAQRRLPAPDIRRALRERVGLAQQDIADALGVTRVTVTRWESGARTPQRANAASYAALLDRLAEER